MSNFDDAIPYVLVNECGPKMSDKVIIDNNGYLCKFGLNVKYNPGLLKFYGANLERLDLDAAKCEYWKAYWLPIMEQIQAQRVATKLLDARVNPGTGSAGWLLQKAIAVQGLHVIPDGIIGSQTILLTNVIHEDDLLNELCRQLCTYYTEDVEKHPEKESELKGWLARAVKIPPMTQAATNGGSL